jgi:hypothetical protein
LALKIDEVVPDKADTAELAKMVLGALLADKLRHKDSVEYRTSRKDRGPEGLLRRRKK